MGSGINNIYSYDPPTSPPPAAAAAAAAVPAVVAAAAAAAVGLRIAVSEEQSVHVLSSATKRFRV